MNLILHLSPHHMKNMSILAVFSVLLLAGCSTATETEPNVQEVQDTELEESISNGNDPSDEDLDPSETTEKDDVEDKVEEELSKTSEPENQSPDQEELDEIFGMSQKEEGTELYYSDELEVGFTYLSPSPTSSIKITEEGNKIYLHMEKEEKEQGQSIEVFEKEPRISLKEAIEQEFLKDIDPKDCFVEVSEKKEGDKYVRAQISYPKSDVEGEPWWAGGEKCPENYKKTNGGQYFFMDENVPDKFLFIKLGQAVWAFDGTPKGEGNENGKDWSSSIKVF